MNFIKKPKQLLLIDSSGAFLTTMLLLLVVKHFNLFFGLTTSQINTLAIIAGFICSIGIGCWFTANKNWKAILWTLASLNVLYCLTTVLVLNAGAGLTIYGIAYFLIEIIIILVLAILEIKTALRLKQKP